MQKILKEKTEGNDTLKALNLCKSARDLIRIRKPQTGKTAVDIDPGSVAAAPYMLVALGDAKRMQKQFKAAASY